ncbi:MAG: helix-turn-helix domain-containing protein [Candidatus Omnitrophica bacterium]|nr:helix-turn-helix domain-containing protein [Candidatus Omnitrophota bacterium]
MAKYLFANINKEDIKKLYELLKNGEEYIKKRVHTIILSGIHRYKVSEISKIVKLHPNHLRKWIHRYNERGIDVILDSPKTGKKEKFGENVKNIIFKIAKIPPRKLGLLFSTWTLYKLKKYLEENKIIENISHETIRKIIKKMNINFKEKRYEEV